MEEGITSRIRIFIKIILSQPLDFCKYFVYDRGITLTQHLTGVEH